MLALQSIGLEVRWLPARSTAAELRATCAEPRTRGIVANISSPRLGSHTLSALLGPSRHWLAFRPHGSGWLELDSRHDAPMVHQDASTVAARMESLLRREHGQLLHVIASEAAPSAALPTADDVPPPPSPRESDAAMQFARLNVSDDG